MLGEPNESPEYEAFLQAQAEKQKEVDQWLDERRLATEDELRSRIADYLVHFSKTLPQYREDNLQPQGKRGALRRAAVRRWQQFLSNPQESTGAVWSLWHQLAALPAGEFTDKALAIVEQAGADHDVQDDPSSMMVPSRLINALREAKPSSMPEAAQCFGDCFEAVYAQWLDARKADATTEHLSDPQDESLRQVMWAAGAPTTLDVAQMISHLDQGERDRYNQLLS